MVLKEVFSETGALQGPYPAPMEPNIFCVKKSKYKLIFMKTADEWKLLELDPKEEYDILDKKPETISESKNKLNS